MSYRVYLIVFSTTLIEINALVDVLSIIKEGKYLAINPVADDSQETNLSLYLSGKKRVSLIKFFSYLF